MSTESPTLEPQAAARQLLKSTEWLDVVAPIVVEGELAVIRHLARGEFLAVVELQVREARRVR